MKYGTGAGQLQKATGSANVTSIICEYADACLIGAAIKSDAASAGEVSLFVIVSNFINKIRSSAFHLPYVFHVQLICFSSSPKWQQH